MKFLTNSQLKSYIDNNIPHTDILSKYLNISMSTIFKCLNNRNYKINNPLRIDDNPSLGFQFLNDKLYCKDFANPFYSGDIYHIVGMTLHLNCNNSKDFVKICKHIINTFDNNDDISISKINIKPTTINNMYVSKIDIIKRRWNKDDWLYWNKRGIKSKTLLKSNIYPIEGLSINDLDQHYVYTKNDPAYAYYLGRDLYHLWEIYRPFADKKNKFRTNNKKALKELYTIRYNENLIITKSKKDKTLILQILDELYITNTDVLYTSEGSKLNSNLRNLIETYYNNIYINFDIDIAGIKGMQFYKTEYNYKLFPFITEEIYKLGNMPKDISDFCYKFGYNNTKKLFNNLYRKYISHGKY